VVVLDGGHEDHGREGRVEGKEWGGRKETRAMIEKQMVRFGLNSE
jgi:hypothetical protein